MKLYGPVCSTWGRQPKAGVRNNSIDPLDFNLGSDSLIEGTLGTTLSQKDFVGDPNLGDASFLNGIQPQSLRGNVAYNEPDLVHLRTQDFDTSPLKNMTLTANLPAPDQTNVSLGMWGLSGKKWVGRNGTNGKNVLNNIRVPKGTNPFFENCKFTGITYIEVDEQTSTPTSSNQNGVVFSNCTFEGPIITGVPKSMDWGKNSMEFRGTTRFATSMIQSALGGVTLMAPNYNVNIGGCEGGGASGNSEICGLVIGGVVDLYSNIAVHGTVISMAELVDANGHAIMGQADSWLSGSGVCGSNLGNLDGSSTNVVLRPDPANVIPLGIKQRLTLSVAPASYSE